MRDIANDIVKSALLGAGIGAMAALLTIGISLEEAAGGAMIGLVIGVLFGLRLRMRRSWPQGSQAKRARETGRTGIQ